MKINNIIKLTKKYYDYFININESINYQYIDNKNLLNKYIHEINNTRFSNNINITKYVNKCNKIFYINYNNINIFVYCYNYIDCYNFNKFIKIIKRLAIIDKIYNLNKNFNIHVSLSNYPRFLPSKKEIFDSKHVNGGFTIPDGNNIYIFRKDEYSKVIIHEFIHHIHIINDSLFNLNQYHIKLLKKKFDISNETSLLPAEGVVEFWTTIYNTIFISIEYNFSFKLLIKKEIDFSIYQIFKIINNYKYPIWQETTNVFSYFFIKTILLVNYNKFLELNLPYNHTEFINYIFDNYDLIKYKKYFDKIKNNFNYKSNKSLDFLIFSKF